MAGKGDTPRPVNGPKYRENFEIIFPQKSPCFSANICQHMPTPTTAATKPHPKATDES